MEPGPTIALPFQTQPIQQSPSDNKTPKNKAWLIFFGIAGLVLYILGGSLHGTFCPHVWADYCFLEIFIPSIVFLGLGGICTIVWLAFLVAYLKGRHQTPLAASVPHRSSVKGPIGVGILTLILFIIGGGIMGSNLNRYHNYPVEIVSITVLSIGGLSGLTFIVMFIVHLNSRNNGTPVQNLTLVNGQIGNQVQQYWAPTPTHNSGLSKWWPISFGILSLALLGTGAGLLISFYNKISSVAYYWDEGVYMQRTIGIVCLGLGGLFSMLWLLFLILYCTRRRPVAPIYFVTPVPMQTFPSAQEQNR